MSQFGTHETEHDACEMCVVQLAGVFDYAYVVSNLVKNYRFPHCPHLIRRDGDHPAFHFIVRAGASLSTPNTRGTNIAIAADTTDVGLDVIQATESQLDWCRQPGPEEIDFASTIEDSGPLVFSSVHGLSVPIACMLGHGST
jgi:hypothetical protein